MHPPGPSPTVVVVTGASPLDRRAVAAVPADALIIAADGGLDHARAAGLDPDVLVGDLDSISALGLAWATEHVEVVRHPVDKAATDTELAIAHAATYEPSRILLVAGPGRPPRPRHRRARRARRARARAASPRWRRGGATTSCTWSTPPTRSSSTCPPGPCSRCSPCTGRRAGVTVSWRPLAADRPRPRPARRPRRQQRRRPDPRPPAVHHRCRRDRHRRRPRSRLVNRRLDHRHRRHRRPAAGRLRRRRRLAADHDVAGSDRRATHGDGAGRRRLDHPRDVRVVARLDGRGAGRVHDADRHRRQGRQGRRHRHDGPEGGAHRGQPGGRRDVRRRQHVPVRGRRRQGLRPVHGAGPRRRPEGAHRRSCPAARPRPSTSATSASTSTRPGSTSTSWPRRPTSTPSPTRRTRTSSSSRTRRRRRRGWRSCWPRS